MRGVEVRDETHVGDPASGTRNPFLQTHRRTVKVSLGRLQMTLKRSIDVGTNYSIDVRVPGRRFVSVVLRAYYGRPSTPTGYPDKTKPPSSVHRTVEWFHGDAA